MAHPHAKKEIELRLWTDTIAKNMDLFKEGNELMVRKHQKSNIKTSSYAITLKEMAETEESKTVKDALEVLSNALNTGENHRLLILAHLQGFIVDQFAKYPSKLKVQKVNIEARNKAVKVYCDKERAYQQSAVSGNIPRQNEAREVLERERQRLRSAEDILNGSTGEFERERVGDMKGMLKKYLQAQIYFFSRQLEELTKAYQAVCKIDPEQERAAFLRKLKALEVDDGTGIAAAQPSK